MEDITDIIDKLRRNKMISVESCKKLLYCALYDNITGLKNRHSLDLRIQELNPYTPSTPIVIIFADVNALKFTNDHISHDAGDNLIRKCAFLLMSYFGEDNCYRISGDEFVVLINKPLDASLICSIMYFIKTVHNKDIPPMSIGWYYNYKKYNTEYVIDYAERKMYKDKEKFYKRFPEFKR